MRGFRGISEFATSLMRQNGPVQHYSWSNHGMTRAAEESDFAEKATGIPAKYATSRGDPCAERGVDFGSEFMTSLEMPMARMITSSLLTRFNKENWPTKQAEYSEPPKTYL
jgi:hypothetical protein